MRWKKSLIISGTALTILLAAGAVCASWLLRVYHSTPIDLSKLTATSEPTTIYDKNGSVYMTLGGTIGNLRYSQLPKNLQNAVVATEDHTFWQGSSVDTRSVLRAVLVDVTKRSTGQGASTIQEQLAKIVYLNDNKTLSYKLKQMMMGIKIDQAFSREQILTMYLNKVYLGESSSGVAQAAIRYFGVNLNNPFQTLTLDQSALLAGLPQAPTEYDPLAHPQAALERRNQVLENMAKYHYITEQVASAAEKAPLGVHYHSFPDDSWTKNPLFTNVLFDYAAKNGISADELLHGGLKIYTTIDPKVQDAVNRVFWSKNYNGDFPGGTSGTIVQGSAVFVDPKTGGVLGAAGSRQEGFTEQGTDRVYMNTSPGSSIKPIMEYAPAIQSGKWHPTSILDNKPQDFGNGYKPQNWDPTAPAKVTLQYGLQWSQNVASVWLLKQLGIQNGTAFAMKDGISLTPTDQEHLGVAIGGMQYGVNPLEMAQGYEAFDNQGIQMKGHLFTRVLDKQGHIIYQFHPKATTVMKASTATTMTRLMQDVVDYGTGSGAKIPKWGVAGKTGTVQYSAGLTGESNWVRNAWFDGYTPNLVGSIEIGYDNSSPAYHLTMSPLDPSANASKIFHDIVVAAESGVTPEEFSVGPFPASQGTANAAYNLLHPKKAKPKHPKHKATAKKKANAHRKSGNPAAHKPHPKSGNPAAHKPHPKSGNPAAHKPHPKNGNPVAHKPKAPEPPKGKKGPPPKVKKK